MEIPVPRCRDKTHADVEGVNGKGAPPTLIVTQSLAVQAPCGSRKTSTLPLSLAPRD
jgi:hypothetical protein